MQKVQITKDLDNGGLKENYFQKTPQSYSNEQNQTC